MKPEPNPICSICGEYMVSNGQSSTLMDYYSFVDDKGIEHYHNGNTVTRNYKCKNGHYENYHIPHTCPCGWKQTNFYRGGEFKVLHE